MTEEQFAKIESMFGTLMKRITEQEQNFARLQLDMLRQQGLIVALQAAIHGQTRKPN